ncbi:hypothetical protein ACFOET_13725 [Parapedobacter deserti]|uniref:Uncharacterized protein n=1 Tax=Parapedobacter deserti TaxID=1912957 RepID=A0ABV7JKT0_9SPHI
MTYSISVKVVISPALEIELPVLGTGNFKWPERGAEAFLLVRCLSMDAEALSLDVYALESLALHNGGKSQPTRKATVQVGDMEGRVVVVAIGVSFLRTDSEGLDPLISHNRQYYAAQLL